MSPVWRQWDMRCAKLTRKMRAVRHVHVKIYNNALYRNSILVMMIKSENHECRCGSLVIAQLAAANRFLAVENGGVTLQTRHVLQVIPGIDPDVFEHPAVVVWKGTRYLLIHCALNRLMNNIAHRSTSIETSLEISYWCVHAVLRVQMSSNLNK
jgi:hypothetical protein